MKYAEPYRWNDVRNPGDTLTKEASEAIDAYYKWISETKVDITVGGGFAVDPSKLHASLKPHQRDTAMWILARWRALLPGSGNEAR